MESQSSVSRGTATDDSGNVITEQVRHGAQQIAGSAQDAADQALSQAGGMIQERKSQATDNLHTVSSALRDTANTLRQQDQSLPAQIVDQIAGRVDGVAGYFEQRDMGQLMGEAETFARSNAPIFLGGAFALGVLAARFLKSSAPQPSNPRGTYRSGGYAGNYGGAYYGGGDQSTLENWRSGRYGYDTESTYGSADYTAPSTTGEGY